MQNGSMKQISYLIQDVCRRLIELYFLSVFAVLAVARKTDLPEAVCAGFAVLAVACVVGFADAVRNAGRSCVTGVRSCVVAGRSCVIVGRSCVITVCSPAPTDSVLSRVFVMGITTVGTKSFVFAEVARGLLCVIAKSAS